MNKRGVRATNYFRDVWYPKNRAKHLRLVNEWKRKVVLEVSLLKDAPCTDCGGRFHSTVMEHDHVRGKKIGDVSALAAAGKRLPALREIEKCELVCANCHRMRTYKRRVKTKYGKG